MLPILALATLALTPALNFTSDSVYKNENVLIIEVKENYEEIPSEEEGVAPEIVVTKDLILSEKNLLGYTIYDNPETAYIDGLKFDDEFVQDWIVRDYDETKEHAFLIKTVYTDDIAGMLAAAKDGDFSRILSNPLMIVQLGYYILAALSIALGGFGLFKSKNKKIKSAEEISNIVTDKANASAKFIEAQVSKLLDENIKPVIDILQGQNQKIIEAFILSQSGGKESRLALIDLLKSTASEDVALISDTAIKSVEEAAALKELAKAEADKTVKEIAEGVFEDKDVRF